MTTFDRITALGIIVPGAIALLGMAARYLP